MGLKLCIYAVKFSYVHVLMDICIEMILVGRIVHCFVYKLLICIYNGLHSCTLHMVGLYAIYIEINNSKHL